MEAEMGISEALGEKATQYLTALEELTKQYAPDVVDAALMVVRLEGVRDLIAGLVALAVLLTCLFWIRKACRHVTKCNEEDRYCGEWPVAVTVVCGLLGVMSGVASFVCLANVWTWIAIFEPRLYIARQILGKLL